MCTRAASSIFLAFTLLIVSIQTNPVVPARARSVQGNSAAVPAIHATGSGPTLNKKALARFVGQWFAHSVSIVVHPTGSVTIVERTYTWCSSTVRPPCDTMHGNDIISGVRVVADIHSIAGSVAHASVRTSTVPHTVGNDLTLQLLPPAYLVTHAHNSWLNHLYLCSYTYFSHGTHSKSSTAACG